MVRCCRTGLFGCCGGLWLGCRSVLKVVRDGYIERGTQWIDLDLKSSGSFAKFKIVSQGSVVARCSVVSQNKDLKPQEHTHTQLCVRENLRSDIFLLISCKICRGDDDFDGHKSRSTTDCCRSEDLLMI
ncbi:hypothetical protein QVD17_41405 [Tagetes erecta]|uniref:Uncharacterized protein n=1 Tax=Tagetes erecta TaxID=13708 RepID=A0AAD8JLR5_TARER|nr:hypothetical protein QVD17_41405 [Tagetes erecta]